MDYNILNFKQVLVVLTSKNMRTDIIELAQDERIDANFKFVDSYFEAAKLIQQQVHDPFDNIILNLSVSNRKLKDFVEFIQPACEVNPDYLIEYGLDGNLYNVDIS